MPGRGEPETQELEELDQGDEEHGTDERPVASPIWRPGRRAPRVGVIGSSGAGKTTVIKAATYQWLDATNDVRFLVWDSTIEWGEEHENLHVFPATEFTLEDVCAIALELGDCTVVADEIDAEADVHRGLERDTAIRAIVNYGRHHNVGLFWGVRRVPEIPRAITANTNKLIVLQTTEPADLEWLDKKTGRDGTADLAQRLNQGEWFLWEPGARRNEGRK